MNDITGALYRVCSNLKQNEAKCGRMKLVLRHCQFKKPCL